MKVSANLGIMVAPLMVVDLLRTIFCLYRVLGTRGRGHHVRTILRPVFAVRDVQWRQTSIRAPAPAGTQHLKTH